MTAKTRLGYEGYGVRRILSFASKTPDVGSSHPVGLLSRLGEGGYGVRHYSSFAGKTTSTSSGEDGSWMFIRPRRTKH